MQPRLSDKLGSYSQLLQKLSTKTGTPLSSLVVSFAVLHELTAIIPFVGVWYTARTFQVGNKMTDYLKSHSKEDQNGIVDDYLKRSIKEGEAFAARVGSRYGIFGLDKGKKLNEEQLKDMGSKVASEIANAVVAYVAVKALLPVRIAASAYLSPAFSRRFIIPITSRFKSFRRN